MTRLAALAIMLILAIIPLAFAVNPLEARELTLRITQTGTIYIQEPVATASITLVVPQNTENQVIQRFSVKPDNVLSELVKDQYGNTMLKLKFSDLRSGEYNYAVETIIRSTHTPVSNVDISADSNWLDGEISDRIREIAWYYRETTDLDGVAEIVKLAHSMLSYDPNSKPRTAEEILQTGSGDSTSYAILLTALLHSTKVPARIAIGDAWLPSEEKISDHAWVEVLTNDGEKDSWIPFDATFLRGGPTYPDYVIKWIGEDLPKERVEFIGGGDVTWKQNPDKIDILDSKLDSKIRISGIEPTVIFPHDLYGIVSISIDPEVCDFLHLEPVSCIDENRQPLFSFDNAERTVWNCYRDQQISWFFKARSSNYICPVRIDEQSGASIFTNITINNNTPSRSVSIDGLSSVTTDQEFSLIAIGMNLDASFIFYSPTLNSFSSDRVWTLTLKPGTYDFYIWSDGSLAKKTVTVLERKEFSIAMSLPTTAAIDESAQIRIDATNLLSKTVDATIKLRADNVLTNICWHESNATSCSNEYALTLKAGETQSLEFTTTLSTPGTNTLTASVEDMSASFISNQIEVIISPLKQFERSLHAFSSMFSSFLRMLSAIPRMTLGI